MCNDKGEGKLGSYAGGVGLGVRVCVGGGGGGVGGLLWGYLGNK